MDQAKLKSLIEDKNDRLERHVLNTASDIIDAIVREQVNITRAQENITKLRAELLGLEVSQLAIDAILGE